MKNKPLHEMLKGETHYCSCGQIATWEYMPSYCVDNRYKCENCVPRGCSCNDNEFGDEDPGQPCIEWQELEDVLGE